MNPTSLLVFRRGLASGPPRPFRIEGPGALILGRSSKCDMVLADPTVSARHAAVRLSLGQLLVEDLGSLNGTYLAVGDRHQRLRAGEETPLGGEASLMIGPFRVIPCEEWEEGFLAHAGPWSSAGEQESTTPALLPAGEVSPGATVQRVWERALFLPGQIDPWQRVLSGLMSLSSADRGVMMEVAEGRCLVKGSGGKTGPACLSQRFIDRVLEQGGVVALRPAAEHEALISATLEGQGNAAVLAGVCFPGLSARSVALGYLERAASWPEAFPETAADFARLAGPFLEAIQERDREGRRREAAEGRLRRRPPPETTAGQGAEKLIGSCPRFLAAVEAVRRAAPARTTLLLRGATGTGKEELAHLAHALSPRHAAPFLVVNSAAIPEELLEAELFGHDKGAFTGALLGRAGAFERADGGTLFLDEVGDLSPAAQAKILRVVEGGEICRVGGSRCKVDVRLIAATHRDLERMLAGGAFRADLYYRLRVVEVVLPPLSERPMDVVPLAEHFLKAAVLPGRVRPNGITARAAAALARYGWPGNLRELRNVIERAVVLDGDGVIDLDDLPAEFSTPRGELLPVTSGEIGEDWFDLPWVEAGRRFEAAYFRSLLGRCQGRVQRAAARAGLDRRTLSTKIRRHHLKRTRPAE